MQCPCGVIWPTYDNITRCDSKGFDIYEEARLDNVDETNEGFHEIWLTFDQAKFKDEDTGASAYRSAKAMKLEIME
jgi:hypothetical protein